MPAKKTLDQFIEEAHVVHAHRYDYSKTKYVTTHTKIIVICPDHGEFICRPNDHVKKKSGCPECVGKSHKTTEKFIKNAKGVHGDKYDYSQVDYTNTHTKVKIICPTHGKFQMAPVVHLHQKQGCKMCGVKETGIRKRKTVEKFIENAKKVHGDKYDYSQVKYERGTDKVQIVCKKHGDFTQSPTHHVNSKQGCPECWNERRPPGVGGYHEGYFIKNPDMKEVCAIFYVLEVSCSTDHFIKVGITRNSIKQRYDRAKQGDKYIKKIILHAISMPLYEAWKLEQKVLKQLKEYQYFPNYLLTGKTECLKLNTSVVTKIERILDQKMKLEQLFEKETLPTVKTPGPKALAKLHGCSLEEVEKQIRIGTKVELEHTTDVKKADEIARDHIKEELHYYKHHAEMEKKFEEK